MELDHLRKKIDRVDYDIIKLVEQRFELAAITQKLKKEVEDPKREAQVLQNVSRYPATLVDGAFSKKMFAQIIEESKRLQQEGRMLACFQGEHGAYSEMASRRHLPGAIAIPCAEFAQVFDMVREGKCDRGIVPVENTLGGAVSLVSDLLVDTPLHVVGEIRVPIRHCLLVRPGTDYREIKVVYSHPQALAQCRRFLERNKLETVPYYDTAGAARMLSESRPKATAVIASGLCAQLYNLEVLKENVEDHPANVTRFLVLAREPLADGKGDKCSMVFSAKDEAGALFGILEAFSKNGINLTRIESRPSRKDPGKYVFLLDFEGHAGEGRVKDALERVKKEAAMCRVLGFYPQDKGTEGSA